MEERNELLKQLGFSDIFIEKINEETPDEFSITSFPESTSFVESFDMSPNDTNTMIIDKSNRPQSLVFNSI